MSEFYGWKTLSDPPPNGDAAWLSESGLLWFINHDLLHPLGFALGVDPDGSMFLLGDGSERIEYGRRNGIPIDDECAQRLRDAGLGILLDRVIAPDFADV